jgi:hypothetical protein
MYTISWQVKTFLKAISYPFLVTLTFTIPVLNRDLLTHAGLGWFLVGFSFPWVLVVILIDIIRHFKSDLKNHALAGIIILILYLILSYPFAFIFQKVATTISYPMDLNEAWKFYIVPFSLFIN